MTTFSCPECGCFHFISQYIQKGDYAIMHQAVLICLSCKRWWVKSDDDPANRIKPITEFLVAENDPPGERWAR